MIPPVHAQRQGRHLILTLDRPGKLNALDYALIDALMAHLDDAEADDAIRCLILTGRGTRAFSAGADITGFAADVRASPEQAWREFAARGQRMTSRIESFPKPIIAAVNGLAFGGGCETVEACTLAIAATHATFAKPEIRLGFPPPFGGTQRLPRLVGRKRALSMLLTGDSIAALQALEMGLVNQVADAGGLMDQALSLAERIARHGPGAVRTMLRAVHQGLQLPMAEALQAEAAQFMIAAASAEASEGIQAFLDRRPAGH